MPKWWKLEIPEFLPMLREGAGASPIEGGCILQVIDFLDNGGWTDHPNCVHSSLRGTAISVNDTVSVQERQRLYLLLPRLMGTAKAGARYDVRTASTEKPLSSQMEAYGQQLAEFDDDGFPTRDANSVEFLKAMLDEFDRITKPKASDAKHVSKKTWNELIKVNGEERIRVPVA